MRRSALRIGTPGALLASASSSCPGGASSPRRGGRTTWTVRWVAGAWLLLAVAVVRSSASSAAASPPWTIPDDFTDGFRNPDDGMPLDEERYEARPSDFSQDDYVIDEISAYLQRAQGRLKSKQEQQQRLLSSPGGQQDGEEDEEDDAGGQYEDVLEEEGLLPPPPPKEPVGAAREGHGLGFTYRFPERTEQGAAGRSFAVNPSEPKYYTATVIGRNRMGDMANAWDSVGESEARELERGGGPLRPIQHVGRFPVVKPIKVVSTTGTEIPPVHDVEEMNVPKGSAGSSKGAGGGGGGEEKSDLRVAPHGHAGHETRDGAAGGSSVPAEQVKRERPEKVPLNFGSDAYLTAIIAGCTAAAVAGVLAFAIFWYRLQRNAKAAADVEYPAYGVTGPNQEASAVAAAASATGAAISPTPHSGGSTSPLSTGDRRLAQSAQMYHYQHQKQQIIAMESRASNERRGSVSEVDSEEENEEGDYTVYECPGLAPTGEMEVKNPLFHDDPTPATPSGGNNGRDQRGDGGGGKP